VTDEQYQLIAAAILETAGGQYHITYIGNQNDLIEKTMEDWFGAYSSDDALESLEFLRKLGVIDKSAVASTGSFIRIDTGGAVFKLQRGSGLNFNSRKVAPLLHEYAQFGRPWLEAIWSQVMLNPQSASGGAAGESSIPDYEQVLEQIIPAADRTVRPDHNLPDYVDALGNVQEARRLIEQSNQLAENERLDTLVHLDAGLSLLTRARNYTVGAIRYLILDRLKKAFEGAIEDAFKAAILLAFMTLATVLIWMIGS
jgi:hypothetical protein